MTDVELKPCPFCANEPTPYAANDMREAYKGHTHGFTIFCETCGIEMADEYWLELAERWNTRA